MEYLLDRGKLNQMVHALPGCPERRRFQLQVRPAHGRFVTGNGRIDPGANEGQLVAICPGLRLQANLQ